MRTWYKIEYRTEVGRDTGWYGAGNVGTEAAVIDDYRAHTDKYKSNLRRCLKVTETLVSFTETITIKEAE